MKKFPLRLLPIALCFVSLSSRGSCQEAAKRTFAQAIVEQALGANPNLNFVGIHAVVPGTTGSVIIASNLPGRIGNKDDEGDIEVFRANKPAFEPNEKKHQYEVFIPLRQNEGKTIGIIVIGYKWNGEDQKQFLDSATAFRDNLQAKIGGVDDLLKPAGNSIPLLVPTASVEIPGPAGNFDFLEVDPVNNRLLGAHEKAGTADFIDLGKRSLIKRLESGPAVQVAYDAVTNRYFVSNSDEKNIAVVDAKTMDVTAKVPTDGDLDSIVYVPENKQIYAANDNGTHVWVIDTVALKVTATIDIPGIPEYMVHDSATNRIYVNIKDKNEVAVIDLKTNQVVAEWPTAPAASPHGLALDLDTGNLFSAGGNGVLVLIDTKRGKVVASTDIAQGVDQAAFDPATRRIYCAAPNWISVAHATNSGVEFLGNVASAATAKNVAVDPRTHEVWTTFTEGSTSYAKAWHP